MLAIVRRLMSSAYRKSVRRMLPSADHIAYAGVVTGARRKVFDHMLPAFISKGLFSDQAGYEEALASGLRQEVRAGDTVVVVGGGIGVTVAIAAMQAGPTGRVICFEGDAAGCRAVRETVTLNGVGHTTTVEHAVVGENIAVYGSDVSSRIVGATALPECDVMELDCEGAELGILRGMSIRPRSILVETHGCHGAPTKEVASALQAIGYAVTDLGWAEPRIADTCAANDIRVLAGRRRPS